MKIPFRVLILVAGVLWCSAICGVRVVTYCVMSNHFHVLVEVPQRPVEMPDDAALMASLKEVYGDGGGTGTIRQRLEFFRAEGAQAEAEALRESFFARMWDVSAFMKLLKQRFTQWFNRTHQRKGTLWEERFKSVLVEGAGTALATMAAYIDLNPVRAGIVGDPKGLSVVWLRGGHRRSGSGEGRTGDRRRSGAGLSRVGRGDPARVSAAALWPGRGGGAG